VNKFVEREKVKVEKYEETDDEVVFVVRDERGDIAEVHRFRKPHSTYVDWWLQHLEQRVKQMETALNEIKEKLKVG